MKKMITSLGALAAAALLVTGCGGSAETPERQDAPASEGQSAAPVEADAPAEARTEAPPSPDRLRNPMVNRIKLTVNGAAPVVETPPADTITLVGGCINQAPLSFGFQKGEARQSDWFYVSMKSAGDIEPDATGEFELDELVWDNGVRVPEGLPDDTPVRIPNKFKGKGTLTISRHNSTPPDRLLAGIATGELTREDTGERAQVTVSFEIKKACS